MEEIWVRDTVRFYKTEQLANEALARYISDNIVTDARMVTFTDDDYLHDFEYVDMEEQYWWGVQAGIRVISETGERIVFAYWEDGMEHIEEESSVCTEQSKNEDFEHLCSLVTQAMAMFN